jgi:putative flippase GtrA
MSVSTQSAPKGLAGQVFGPETVKFLSFVLAAGMSVPINLLVRMGLSLVAPYEVAVVIAHFAGMAAAFFATKLFVFEASGRPVGSEMVRFAMVNAVSLAQTWIVAVGLVRFVFPATGMTVHPELVAHVIGLGSTAVTSYLLHRYFSFRHSRRAAAGQPAAAKGFGDARSVSA